MTERASGVTVRGCGEGGVGGGELRTTSSRRRRSEGSGFGCLGCGGVNLGW